MRTLTSEELEIVAGGLAKSPGAQLKVATILNPGTKKNALPIGHGALPDEVNSPPEGDGDGDGGSDNGDGGDGTSGDGSDTPIGGPGTPSEAQLTTDVADNSPINITCAKNAKGDTQCIAGTAQAYIVTTFSPTGAMLSQIQCESGTGWTVQLGVNAMANIIKGIPLQVGVNGTVQSPAGMVCTVVGKG